MAATETTEPLTEDTVQAIEAMVSRHHPDLRYPNFRRQLAAVIQDWRALRARIEALTTDWCECGHSRDKHQFFSDHDECYECDQASPDLCCEWRPAPRANENAALREQLAQRTKERDGWERARRDDEYTFERIAASIGMSWCCMAETMELESRIKRLAHAENERKIAVRYLSKQGFARCDQPEHGCDGWHERLTP